MIIRLLLQEILMCGKSTIFNALTRNETTYRQLATEKQSKIVIGICEYKGKKFLLVDIPGTYSIMSNSEEEEIARDYICFGNPDTTVVIVDATCLERNLNLVYQIMEITPNIVVCVNLLDEAKKKGIHIDLEKLEKRLGVPVVGTIARKKKTLENLMQKVEEVASKKIDVKPNLISYLPAIEEAIQMIENNLKKIIPREKQYLTRWISLKLIDKEEKILTSIEQKLSLSLLKNEEIQNLIKQVENLLEEQEITKENIRNIMISSIVFEAESVGKDIIQYENEKYQERDRKIDKILTSKRWGIPIMIIFLGIILWLTIVGANYPSELLSNLFSWLQEKLIWVFEYLGAPIWLKGLLIDGMYKTVTWVISVMLPPMAIFFPMFTLLEDLGYLPRIAFNLDKYFKKACSSRKTGTYHVHGSDKVGDFYNQPLLNALAD